MPLEPKKPHTGRQKRDSLRYGLAVVKKSDGSTKLEADDVEAQRQFAADFKRVLLLPFHHRFG
jgi:hypothetical protein